MILDGSRKILTLCLVIKDGQILLGMKKRGLGTGKWNGFGGKVEVGETIEEATKREMFEESGIEIKTMYQLGINEFEFRGQPGILAVHVYKAVDFFGEPTETEEMRPQWFDLSAVPFAKMWDDDRYWFKLFLADKKFRGRYLFNENEKVIDYSLAEIEDF
ncbi:MAG: 8-oxo-dGTP diphosphatase [Patescibacteria group bacterium]|nr:8-oxo-dGTP diphosphatase [Patescibacteria group bacterium]